MHLPSLSDPFFRWFILRTGRHQLEFNDTIPRVKPTPSMSGQRGYCRVLPFVNCVKLITSHDDLVLREATLAKRQSSPVERQVITAAINFT